jgi:Iap family predicted aminopeptidase
VERVIPCQPVLLSANTPGGAVDGELVVVEGARLNPQVTGRIVLWYCGEELRDVVSDDIQRFSPLAILAVPTARGIGMKHNAFSFGSTHFPLDVPCFMLQWEEAERLILEGVSRVSVELATETQPSHSRNIIADVGGVSPAGDTVLVGAHYDSPYDLVGASDNASGMAMVLELARQCANRRAEPSVRFVGWGAEETGYIGSRHYVSIEEHLDRHLLCVNLDVLGFPLGQHACYALAESDIGSMLLELADELGVQLVLRTGEYGSDHELFAVQGIPGVCFTREGPRSSTIHTVEDSMEWLHPRPLAEVGALVDTFLSRIVSVAQWPFGRTVPAELVARLRAREARLGVAESPRSEREAVAGRQWIGLPAVAAG